MTTTLTPTSYDTVPYDSHPFVQSHPDRLATVATLLGLKPAAVAKCRVLELGCAGGGNLLPMAAVLPESRFVGIDLSRVQLAAGQEFIDALGLKNIELKHLSIADVSAEFGKFDYIVCHGVFSWVPRAVQEKIFAICAENLAPHGIAYISYNTYPGWHMRGMIRDMLGYHAKQFVDPLLRVRQARNLLDFLARSVERENSPYSLMLKQEVDAIRRSSDAYLFHEHLEDVNDPCYFFQFMERATAHRLKYLGEVDLRVMVPANYPPEIESVLHMLSPDILHLEQYMDFLRHRTFRQTLLCHASQNPNYALRSEVLKAFHVASPARVREARPAESMPSPPAPFPEYRERGEILTPLSRYSGRGAGGEGIALDTPGEGRAERSNLHTTDEVLFETPDGITLTSRDPIVKTAMVSLGKVWPRTIPFMELLSQARAMLKAQGVENQLKDDITALSQALLTFYASASTSLLELALQPAKFVAEPTEQPEAWPFARQQAAAQSRVTNLRHESIYLGEFERHLLRLLDGTHTRKQMVARLTELVTQGDLTVEKDGQPVIEPAQVRDMVGQAVETQLQTIARSALLVR